MESEEKKTMDISIKELYAIKETLTRHTINKGNTYNNNFPVEMFSTCKIRGRM